MDPGSGGGDLLEGWRALEAAQWDAAREAFEAALEAGKQLTTAMP